MRVTILIHFPDPADSPNGASPLRVRYSLRPVEGRTMPVLTYGHGQAALTRETWAAWRMAGATLTAESAREQGIVLEVLGDG